MFRLSESPLICCGERTSIGLIYLNLKESDFKIYATNISYKKIFCVDVNLFLSF